jgi:hypothetical protein
MFTFVEELFPYILINHASIPSHNGPDIKLIVLPPSFPFKQIKFLTDMLYKIISIHRQKPKLLYS